MPSSLLRAFLELADQHGALFILDTATLRATRDWGIQLGYDDRRLVDVNCRAVAFAHALADTRPNTVINGVIGPRGDGYVVGTRMSVDEGADHHWAQVDALAKARANQITAVTMTYRDEVAGIVEAARSADIPVAISFTVETDGLLPDGASIGDAIAEVDRRTESTAAFFMSNCAHPKHIAAGLDGVPPCAASRACASRRRH